MTIGKLNIERKQDFWDSPFLTNKQALAVVTVYLLLRWFFTHYQIVAL